MKNSWDYYNEVLEDILIFTNRPKPVKDYKSSTTVLSKSTALNLTIDAVVKLLVYLSNPPASVRTCTTRTSTGSNIRVYRDPLEWFMNYSSLRKYHFDFKFRDDKTLTEEFLSRKLDIVTLVNEGIYLPKRKSKPMDRKALAKLIEIFEYSGNDTNGVIEEMYLILDNIDIANM